MNLSATAATDDNFTALLWDSKARIRVVYEFRQWYKLDSVAVVEVLLRHERRLSANQAKATMRT